MFEIIIN